MYLYCTYIHTCTIQDSTVRRYVLYIPTHCNAGKYTDVRVTALRRHIITINRKEKKKKSSTAIPNLPRVLLYCQLANVALGLPCPGVENRSLEQVAWTKPFHWELVGTEQNDQLIDSA